MVIVYCADVPGNVLQAHTCTHVATAHTILFVTYWNESNNRLPVACRTTAITVT